MAARRSQRTVFKVVDTKSRPINDSAYFLNKPVGVSYKREYIIAVIAAITLHTAIVKLINNSDFEATPAVRKLPPLALEIAPPPKKELPPPPPIKEKPLPKIAKSISPIKKVAPSPSVPIVSENVPQEAPSETDTIQVAKSEPEPAPPKPAPAPVETTTEPRGYAGYLNNPAPTYPIAAQKRGIEGSVLLKVHVLTNGKADTINIEKSSGHGILDDAAIKAVKDWVFEPAKRGNTPIDGWVQVPLTFKL